MERWSESAHCGHSFPESGAIRVRGESTVAKEAEIGRMQPGAGACQQPLEADKGQEMNSPLWASRRNQPCHLHFSPVKLISDFGPPELQENRSELFEASKFVVICYSSNGKLVQLPLILQLPFHADLSSTPLCPDNLHIILKWGIWEYPVLIDPKGHVLGVGGLKAAEYLYHEDKKWLQATG